MLYSFDGTHGYQPYGGLAFDAAGNLYGMTAYGGTNQCSGGPSGCGVVFEVVPSAGGWTEQVLYNFDGTHGNSPTSGVTFDAAGNLYGTTTRGGAYRLGTVFELTPSADGWTEQVLHSFNGADGGSPASDVIFDVAGNLYGMAPGGGAYGGGTVFELTPSAGGWTTQVLYNFDDPDGASPSRPPILDATGNLYGTTYFGGASGLGVVFEISGCQITDYMVPGLIQNYPPANHTCWASAGSTLVSWKEGQALTEDQVTYMADHMPPFDHGFFQLAYDNDENLQLFPTENFLSRLNLKDRLFVQPTVCQLNSRLHQYGPTWIVAGEIGSTAHAETAVGIYGDGTETGTYLRVLDPADGMIHVISYQMLLVQTRTGTVFSWPEWLHF